jgi:TonB family protein
MDASLDIQEFNITEGVYVMPYHQLTSPLHWMQRRSRPARPNACGTAIKPVSNPLYRPAAWGRAILLAAMTAALAQPVCAGAPWNASGRQGHALPLMMAADAPPAAPQNAADRQKREFSARLYARIASVIHHRAPGNPAWPSGTVLLRFTLARNGSIADIQIYKSSGHPVLDNEAIESLKRAQPLPPLPASLPAPTTFMIPFAFVARQ